MNERKEAIRAYILETFLPEEDPEDLTDATPLVSTGILDSLATIKLIAFLEERFGIQVAPHEADAEYLDTVDRIERLVGSKLGGGAAG